MHVYVKNCSFAFQVAQMQKTPRKQGLEPGEGTEQKNKYKFWGTETEPCTKVIPSVPEHNCYFQILRTNVLLSSKNK